MFKSAMNLRKVLDLLAEGHRLGQVMGAIGAHQKLIYAWLKSDDLYIDWPEGEPPRLFRTCAAEARKLSVVAFEQAMRNEVLHGIPRLVIEKGEIQYQLDPTFLGWSDDDMRALGFDPADRYLRGKDRRPVPLVVYEPAPAHLKIKMLSSLIPGTYGERKTIDINERISGGVMVLSGKPQEPQQALPRTEAPALASPEHHPMPMVTEALDHHDDGEPDDAPEPAAENPSPAGQGESDSVRDLRRRVAELEARGPLNPAPRVPAMVGHVADDDVPDDLPDPRPAPQPRPQPRVGRGDEGIGLGHVVPGGYRTA